MGKFDKKTVCEYCEGEMKSTYRNKRFCSDKCRVYFNREKHKVNIKKSELKKEVEIIEDNYVDINKERRENILALIELIKSTPIPKERNTPAGRISWKFDIEQKIKPLKEKLKSL